MNHDWQFPYFILFYFISLILVLTRKQPRYGNSVWYQVEGVLDALTKGNRAPWKNLLKDMYNGTSCGYVSHVPLVPPMPPPESEEIKDDEAWNEFWGEEEEEEENEEEAEEEDAEEDDELDLEELADGDLS
jgi:hypothetical protein